MWVHYHGAEGGESGVGDAKAQGHTTILTGVLVDPWDKTKKTAQIIIS